MNRFDITIIGAGPAGAYCARLLSEKGLRVLLVEKNRDSRVNAFSSAGIPWECLEQFELPPALIASTWSGVTLVSKNQQREWVGRQPLGAVLDFANLRVHLATTARDRGAQLRYGRYLEQIESSENETSTLTFRVAGSEEKEIVRTKFIIDATGPARAVLKLAGAPLPSYQTGTGIEYVVSGPVSSTFVDRLTLYLGPAWVPNGYGWVFPMQPGVAKVGVAQLTPDDTIETDWKPLLQKILTEVFGQQPFDIIEKHGGVLRYTAHHREPFFYQNILAVGDAVSAVNALGGEGIRHALYSGRLAAAALQERLRHDLRAFPHYQTQMKRYFGSRWKTSAQLAEVAYLGFSDAMWDRYLRYLSRHTTEQFMRRLMGYSFSWWTKLGVRILTRIMFLRNFPRKNLAWGPQRKPLPA